MMRVVVLMTLAGLACGAEVDSEKPNNALKRVINLLSEMKAQLEQEAKDDSELYDKMVCWCDTNSKEKTQAVADEEQAIIDLGHAINENVAKEATLTSEISALKSGIAENQESLAKAEEMRTKEEDAFIASEKQATQSTAATKNAIMMLKKHNSLSQTSFVELRKATMQDAGATKLFRGIEREMDRKGAKAGVSFLQTDQAPSAGSYAPASGAVFGILEQMLETFEQNSANSKKEEAEAIQTYADLKKSKTAEIKASTEKVTTKTEEAATAGEVAANSKQSLADTRAALAADTEFLANLKVTCENLDREWAQRTKTRADETAAVAETISILTDDDNSEQMAKGLNFLQQPSSMDARAREVSRLLRSSRKPTKGSRPQTGFIQRAKKQSAKEAAKALLNPAFAKVKDSVGKMKSDLKDQKKEEVKTNEECIDELRQLDVDMTASTKDKEDAETQVADLTNEIAALDDDVKALKKRIGETQVEMKRASQDRELENKDFQATVADQRATQAVLKKAVDRLSDFYGKKAAALIQQSGKTHPMNPSHAMKLLDGFLQESKQTPPGGGFQPYKKKGGAGGVMGMIQDLADDSKKLEAEAVLAEKDAQAAYETFIADSKASVDADTTEISNKQAEKGEKDGERTEAQASADAALKDLVSLGEKGGLLHKKCDFLLKNFDARQGALESEMEALDQSMAMLSGA